MAGHIADGGQGGINWRIIGWGGAAALLATPFVAMQFTREVDWSGSDFIVMGVLVGTVGLLFECGARLSRSIACRAGFGLGLLAAFLLVWVNMAVGMIGSEGNPFNLLFAGVIAVAIGGACIARFRAAGMAHAMHAAAGVQALAAAAGATQDPRGAVLTAMLAGLWAGAAALFRKAARDEAAQVA